MINVLIVDDHVAVGAGTKILIEQEDIQVDVLVDSRDVEGAMKNKNYDVYLIDLYMPNINGLELTKKILSIEPDASILIYTGFEIMPHFNLLIENGVLGILSKTASKNQILTSIYCATRKEAVIPHDILRYLRISEFNLKNTEHIDIGLVTLTKREEEILIEIENGRTNREISEILNLSQRSIEYTLSNLFAKLKVSSRMEAIKRAKEIGIMPYAKFLEVSR
ncbi:response regulator transcription factor [Bacillus pacificus]|uniref:response regulator n=1 Tax=Bacillus TaxID=1386 RepID=UPI001FB1E475|nr:response regulator transcription factor [Bacillus sp. ZJS3]UOB79042.1 response regulator transcription factor [Bacillus sp. ZJS3]